MPDNFVWTKHIEERSRQRGVGDNEVWSTLKYPDTTEKIDEGKFKFSKQLGDKRVVLVAIQQGGKWVILTTWIKDHAESKQYWNKRKMTANSRLQNWVSKLLFGRRRVR